MATTHPHHSRRALVRSAAFCLCVFMLAASTALADSTADSNDESKDEKNLVMAKIVSVEADGVLIIASEKKGTEQKLRLMKDTRIHFVGFEGIGQHVDKAQQGFGLKATVDGDVIKSILFSPPYPPLKEIPDKHKLTEAQLFKIADENKNGAVDFVEYATWIFQSAKHLPDRYATKFDLNHDDVLDLKEFSASLDRLDWWRLSRKTAEEWVLAEDKDKSGQLEQEEARAVTGGAHGNFDKLFNKLDRDKSGGISPSELKPYLEANIAGRKKADQ